ncbi:MAG: hypothetical protein DDT34_02317 [Firmicutes bacterium]|nr:hypothetical protein [Bacillota bacterium]
MREFLGIPIVRISGVNFDTPAGAGGVLKSFYLARQSEDDGIFFGFPGDSMVLDMQDPFAGGSVIQEGYVEMVTQVVPLNPNAVLHCSGVMVRRPTA